MAARIGFSGFLTGSQVGINAASQSRNTSAEGWGVATAAGTPRATIVPKRGDLRVAPEGVNFEVVLENFDTPGPTPAATGSYDPQFHEVYYAWSFGDAGATFSAPQNILPEHRDANKAYGKIVSHTFAGPGTYTITVDVIEPASGKTAQATLDVTVNDPDAIFSGHRTLYVDLNGDFSAAPTGAQLFDSLQTAFARAGQTTGPTDYFRIMLNRGKTYPFSGGLMRSAYKNLYMCAAPGAGADPIIDLSPNTNIQGVILDQTSKDGGPGKQTDLTFVDLDIRGTYDTTTQTGYPQLFLRNYADYCTYSLFHNCRGDGLENLYYNPNFHVSGDTVGNVKIFNNTIVENCRNFCVFVLEGSGLAMTGVRFVHHVEAISGGEKALGGNEHAGIRIQYGYDCVVDGSDFFSRTGWYPNALGYHTPQPCFRWNQSSNPTGRLNIQRTHMESGATPLNLTVQDNAYIPVPHNMLVDKCYFLAGPFATDAALVQHSGLHIRNSVFVHPAVDRNVDGMVPAIRFLRMTNLSTDTATIDAPMRVYNNTFIQYLTKAENQNRNEVSPTIIADFGSIATVPFSDIIETNNIRHLPNYTPAESAAAPLDATSIWTPRYTDYRDRSHPLPKTLTVAVANGADLGLDYSEFGAGLTNADFAAEDLPLYYTDFWNEGLAAAATFTYDADKMRITNDSGVTWEIGHRIIANPLRSALHIRPEFGIPANSMVLAAPLPGSPALGAAVSGITAVDDMLGNLRPAFPSIGACEMP